MPLARTENPKQDLMYKGRQLGGDVSKTLGQVSPRPELAARARVLSLEGAGGSVETPLQLLQAGHHHWLLPL